MFFCQAVPPSAQDFHLICDLTFDVSGVSVGTRPPGQPGILCPGAADMTKNAVAHATNAHTHISIYIIYIYILCIRYTLAYIYIYIRYTWTYIWYPPKKKSMQTSILLVFTVIFLYFGTDFVPIKFEAPTVGKLKNWKTEKLNSIGEVWGPFFSCGIQFFSFSVLGFSWKVKTRKVEKTEKIKWPQAVSII